MAKKTDNLKYEFLPAALEITETPPNKFGALVLWILIALILAALAWAYFGHLDIVATARGKIKPDGNVKIVQTSAGGVVTAINVSDGDEVKEGELLVSLDSTAAQKDVVRLQENLAVAQLERDVTRLIALNQDASHVIESSTVSERTKEDLRALASSKVSSYQVQRQFASIGVSQASSQLNRENANLSTVQASLASAQQTLQAAQAAYDTAAPSDKAALQVQLNYANSIVDTARDAVSGAHDRVAAAQNAQRQAQSSLAELNGNNTTSALELAVNSDKTIAQIEAELDKAKKAVEDQSIYSPVDGRVMALSVNTVGGVVSGGQQLAIIVPTSTLLTIEATIQNQDIGFVHVGQRVAIKVDTFSFQRYGVLEGKVRAISPDAIQNETTGALTYPIQVSIEKNQSSKNVEIPLQSGMSITAEVKTGDRRIIDFFLDPLFGGVDESFKVR